MSNKSKRKPQQQKAPLVKCLICGNVIKITKWRKHLSRFHGISEPTSVREYYISFDTKKKYDVKCRLCGAVIKGSDWKWHLAKSHKVEEFPKYKDYFVKSHCDIEKAQNKWYNPNKPLYEETTGWQCGTIVNGPPKITIIYNAAFSQRKKF